MKKIDFHIHTIKTISDRSDFAFDINVLQKYVMERQIDAIAITNHNCFDMEQFEDISKKLNNIIVFPGIEINIGKFSVGHLIVIADINDKYDFYQKCLKVNDIIKKPTDYISEEEFFDIFTDLGKYLLIPHYQKKPAVDKNIIKDLEDNLICGEVESVKKFIYCMNDGNITPVIFSDFRPESLDIEFPVKQTFIDVESLTLASIKKALLDKTKVGLSANDGHQIFEALPGLPISTGLTVIMGERSSGKTHTLNAINDAYPDCKYIRQFSLLEINEEKADKTFRDKLAAKQSGITRDYFNLFYEVVNDIKNVSIENDETKLEEYITSLKANAEETNRADAFAKCKLYSEAKYSIGNLQNINSLIAAVEKLLDARTYQEIINKHINRDSLISLYIDLVTERRRLGREISKKIFINGIIGDIQQSLQQKSAQTNVTDCDLYSIAMNRKKVAKFQKVVNLIKRRSIIWKDTVAGFTMIIAKKPYEGAQELKNHSKSKMMFSEAYRCYDNAYEFLCKLKDIDGLKDDTYYEYFVNVEHTLKNSYGYNVSGGERAEYNLIQELSDAKSHDMLLVDEPESSFDNIFLKNSVNQVIKDLSKIMPVIVVTHNNTVGASIKPDFILFTKREITDNNGVIYRIFYGRPEQKYLEDGKGNKVENIQATLDCLEAGEKAYTERGKEYEMLKRL